MSGSMHSGTSGMDDALKYLEMEMLRSEADLDFVSQKLSSKFSKSLAGANPMQILTRLRDAQVESKRLMEELDRINEEKTRLAMNTLSILEENNRRIEHLCNLAGDDKLRIERTHLTESQELMNRWGDSIQALTCSPSQGKRGDDAIA